MVQWQTEVLKAFTNTISHVLVFKEERNIQQWQRIKSNTTWELLTRPSPQGDGTHLSVQRAGGRSSASPRHLQHGQISPLPWKGLKAQHGKGQAGQQQPQSGTGKVTANIIGGSFWFSRPNWTFPVWIPCSASSRGWTRRPPEVPSNLNDFVILRSLQRKGKNKYLLSFVSEGVQGIVENFKYEA